MNAAWLVVLLFLPATVDCLECWLCKVNKTHGPLTFAECDEKKERQTCRSNPTDQKPSCGTFLFTNTKGREIHAKSCVYEHHCGANETFCKGIDVGGTDCRLQCCNTRLCNYHKEGFAPTYPPYEEDEDDDDDDCSWIDSGSTLGLSRAVVWACALHGSLIFLGF